MLEHRMRLPLLASVLLLCAWPLVTASAADADSRDYPITAASPRAARDCADGLAAYHLGRLDEAVRDFHSAIRRDGGCAMAHWGLSRALEKNGKAIDAAEEA